MPIPGTDRATIAAWCSARIPVEHTEEISVVAEFRGNSVNIVELRPPWREDFGPDWSRQRIANLTRHESSGAWTLRSTDRNDRLINYSGAFNVDSTLHEVLEQIELDPTGIFWG